MKRFRKEQIGFLFPPLIFILLFIPALSYGSGDPGAPDTVRFESWGIYIPCPPCTGIAVIPLVIFNDERLAEFVIPLHWSGPLTCDTVEFTGRVQLLHLTSQIFLEDERILLMGIASDTDSIMPPGDGIIAYLYFTLQDTGTAGIDLANFPIPEHYLSFSDSTLNRFIPEFEGTENHILPQNIVPGDVNQDDEVTIADAVYLVNYLFRNGLEPTYLPCADPNIDCLVSISDVVYLVNYVFKNGTKPQLGCAN